MTTADSKIDPTLPLDGVDAVKGDLRTNLGHAKDEIERLQNTISISVEDWGVVPGGDPVTNTTGLIAMRDKILEIQQAAGPDSDAPHFDIHWPPGLYQIDHPTLAPSAWSFGPLRYTVYAYGVKLQSLKSGGSGSGARQPMHGSLPFFFDRNRYDLTGNWGTGYDIDTVEEGSLTVTLKTPAETANFSVGGRALVYGFEHQGDAAPPNCRYFEWVNVVAIDGGTGALTFSEPLQYRYDDKWPLTTFNTASPSGPGKIISLDSIYSIDGTADRFYPLYQHVKGLEVVPNPNQNPLGYDSVLLPGEYLYMTDVIHKNFTPSINKFCISNRCQFFNRVELDKITDYVAFNDCYWRAPILEMSGARTVVLSGGTMNIGDWEDVTVTNQARGGTLLIQFMNIYGYGQASASTFHFTNSGAFPQRRTTFRNNQFFSRSSTNPPACYSQNLNPTITIDGVGPSDELLLTDTTPNSDIWRVFEIGRPIYNRDTGDSGIITAMDEDSGNLRIFGDWSVTPVIGQTWQQHLVGEIQEFGNITVPRANSKLRVQGLPWHSNERGVKTITMTSDEMDFGAADVIPNENDVWGYVKRIMVDVVAASDQGTLTMNLRRPDLTFLGEKIIDLTQPGKREMGENGIEGSRGTDTIDTLGLGEWVKEFNTSISGTPDRVAVILTVEIVGPL